MIGAGLLYHLFVLVSTLAAPLPGEPPPDPSIVPAPATTVPVAMEIRMEAEIRFSGAIEAEGRGRAVFVYQATPSGDEKLVLIIELESGGELHALEAARLQGGLPSRGTYPLLGVDDLPEPDEDFEANLPEGFLTTFQRGKWASWEELHTFASDPEMDFEEYISRSTGTAYATGGEVRFESVSGDGVSGSLAAQMALDQGDGREHPFEVTATFVAAEATLP